MEIDHLLLGKKQVIIKKWFDLILETYPSETAKFLNVQKNRFGNPVGHAIAGGVEGLFEELLHGMDREKIALFLDNIIRVRALQDFTPSQAIGFVFILKKVIREEFESEIRERGLYEELMTFESRIDDLAGTSFDIYMKCREKLYEIKVREAKKLTNRILQRANIIEFPKSEKEDANG